jgi:pimeloyl-ACP methyl ester carboxylesterase
MPILERQGIKLFHSDSGSGRPPLLFVHGFGGDHRHFEPQLAHFARRHRVVAVDRRGHGQSDKPEQEYTVPGFAEELGWTIREAGLDRPVVVVHSMGVIGLELAAHQPDLLRGLVLIDSPLFPPAEVVEAWAGALAGMRTPAWQQVVRGFADQVAFRPGDQSELKQRMVERICALPQHVVASTWAGYLAYDPEPALRGLRLPLLVIRATMPVDAARLGALCPQAEIAEVTGTGHFCQLEAPAAVNGLIEGFLAKHAGRVAAAV